MALHEEEVTGGASRIFGVLIAGQALSKTGTWMNQVALGWLALVLGGSSLSIGVVTGASIAPVLALSLVGGVVADRFSRARILIVASVVSIACYGTLAALFVAGRLTFELLVLIALVTGAAQAFETTAFHALIGQLAGSRIMTVVAMQALASNTARIIGPAVGGVILATMGAGVIFALNGLSYVPLIAALAVIRLPPRVDTVPLGGVRAIREAASFARGHPQISALLALLTVNTLTATAFVWFAPAVAADLGAGADGLGWLLSSAGVGAVVVSAAMTRLRPTGPRVRVIVLSGGALALGQAGLAVSPSIAVSCALTAICGGGFVAYAATSNALLQRLSPDPVRGRIMSFFIIAAFGVTPIGTIILGLLADGLSVRMMLVVAALVWGLVLAAAIARVPALRTL